MNFQFSIFNFQFLKKTLVCYLLLAISYLLLASPVWAQTDLGTFKGLGAYEPPVSQNPIPAGFILANIISNAIGFLTVTAGIFFMFYFMVGALQWLMAGGKPDKVQQAQDTMTHAVIGLIIIVASYAIIFIVGQVLGLKILQPVENILKLGPQGALTGGTINQLEESSQQVNSLIDQVLSPFR